MVNAGGRHIEPDPVTANLPSLQEVPKDTPDSLQAHPLPRAAHESAYPADRDVLEERERSSGFQETGQRMENPLNRFHGEIVERQPGNNQVVLRLLRKLFDVAVEDSRTRTHRPELWIMSHSVAETCDETLIELHEIQPVIRSHSCDDTVRHGPRPRTDFQYVPGFPPGLSDGTTQCVRQLSPAWQNRSGRAAGPQEFAQEQRKVLGGFLPTAPENRTHGGSLTSQETTPRSQCSRLPAAWFLALRTVLLPILVLFAVRACGIATH